MVKIGLDIHGVITKHSQMIIQSIIPLVNETHIITGSSLTMELVEKLMSYNNGEIWWNAFFSINDYLLKKELPHTFNKYNRPVFDDIEWDRAKGDYCKREKINLHMDDTERYKKYFTTPFILIDDFNKIYIEEIKNYLTKNKKNDTIKVKEKKNEKN